MSKVAGRAARRRASVDFPAAIFPQRRYKVGTSALSMRKAYHGWTPPATSPPRREGLCSQCWWSQSRQQSRPPQFCTGLPATSDQPSADTKKVSLSGSDTTTGPQHGRRTSFDIALTGTSLPQRLGVNIPVTIVPNMKHADMIVAPGALPAVVRAIFPQE